jgi:hypothetical protein
MSAPNAKPATVLSADDYQAWLACFQAAISGSLAAQRGDADPEVISQFAANLADCAIVEARKRREPREPEPNA